VNRVRYTYERVGITKHGRCVAALISAEDLELLTALEDRFDLEAVRAALADSDERVPYELVRKELGLE